MSDKDGEIYCKGKEAISIIILPGRKGGEKEKEVSNVWRERRWRKESLILYYNLLYFLD